MKGMKRALSRNPVQQAVVKQAIRVKDAVVAVADGAPGFGTAVIGGLPAGNILLLAAVAYLQFQTADTDVTTTFDGDYSIGTAATADGNVSDAGEADIVQSTALGAATARVSPVVRGVSGTNSVLLDNTDGALELNLNLLIDDAAISGAANFTANGVVHIAYIVLGDD